MTLVLGVIDFLDVTAGDVEVERNAASIYDGEKSHLRKYCQDGSQDPAAAAG